MATQYTDILKLALPTTGELDGTWGDVVNNNITSMVEEAIAGLSTINTWSTNSHTLTTANGTTSESRSAILVLTDTGTALTGAGEVICPDATKLYVVKNDTGQTITVKTSAGTGVDIPDGQVRSVFCDATNVIEAAPVFNGQFEDGSAASPSITFVDDTDTGWYRTASGTIAFSSNGIFEGFELGGPYSYFNKQSVGGFTEYVRVSSTLPRLEYNVTYSGDSVSIFRYQDAVKGSIVVTSTATTYVTSSDYRLKENVAPIENAVARIDNLNPVRFNFISDPSYTVDGFLAHEVTPVVPEAITGEKDAVDEEGNPVYQGIDQSKLVPLLVAAVQELSARVAALEAN
jgi:hypothetical protein